MNIVKTILWSAVSLCLVTGCSEKPSPSPSSPNYIRGYIDPTAIYARAETGNEKLPVEDGVTYFQFTVQVQNFPPGGVEQDYVSAESFRELARRFKDTTFNRPDYLTIPVMFVQTDRIEIIADRDYDASHPAGASLNDLFTVGYICADQILRIPYTLTCNEQQRAAGIREPYFFQSDLNELNALRPTLLALYFSLRLKRSPAEQGVFRFTLTYKNVEGKELTATTNPVRLLVF